MGDCALRTYTIKPGRMDEWLDWWRNNIVPYRAAHGFEVTGAWVDEQANEFVWMVRGRDRSRSVAELTDAYNAAKSVDPARPSAGDHLVLASRYEILVGVELGAAARRHASIEADGPGVPS